MINLKNEAQENFDNLIRKYKKNHISADLGYKICSLKCGQLTIFGLKHILEYIDPIRF